MRKIDTKEIADKIYKMALKAGVSLTADCKAALESAEKTENEGAAKFALETLIQNYRIAEKDGLPVCQDTGMAVVLLDIGQEVFLTGAPLTEAVNGAVRAAYNDGYFRKSVCDPITRNNTGDNTPAVIHTHICGGEQVKITFLPKGFGSENMSAMYMLKPAQGVDGIIDAIVETVKKAGSRPCPPVYVGVGIGGSFDTCAYLAKKALTREIGSHSERADIAEIERVALEKINALNIGCQGFHGKTTALGVSCEWAYTHIAGLPVAVNIQCHCVRCQKETI
ncbi:MAG: fumarate hydratase [Clostridia bacterium]|nr:fumarate hydratase [Clostridia bacterium]